MAQKVTKFWWDYDTIEEQRLHADLRTTGTSPRSVRSQDNTFWTIYGVLLLMSASALYFFINEKPPSNTDVSNTTRAVTR